MRHPSSQRLVILISQVLFAYGTPDTKQASLDQLFAFIEENGASLLVVLTLGAISIVDNLSEYYSAIKEELEELELPKLVGDSRKVVPQMLAELNHRIDASCDGLFMWRRNAIMFPADYQVWKRLNNAMALDVASLSGTKLVLMEMAEAYVQSGCLREMQRGILLSPHDLQVWTVFESAILC